MKSEMVEKLIALLPEQYPTIESTFAEMRDVHAIHMRLAYAATTQIVALLGVQGWRTLCDKQIALQRDIQQVELTLTPSGD